MVDTITAHLQKAEYKTFKAYDGESTLLSILNENPQLVVLDLMMQKRSGWEVCLALRQDPRYHWQAPIIMLTDNKENSAQVTELDLGADAYLPKPIDLRELVRRIRALLRRNSRELAAQKDPAVDITTLQVGDVTMDIPSREVHVQSNGGDRREIQLSAKEFNLLRVLLEFHGQAVSRLTLLHCVWGANYSGDEHTLDVHIRWLRKKLEPNPSQPQYIVTVHGMGYKFKG